MNKVQKEEAKQVKFQAGRNDNPRNYAKSYMSQIHRK